MGAVGVGLLPLPSPLLERPTHPRRRRRRKGIGRPVHNIDDLLIHHDGRPVEHHGRLIRDRLEHHRRLLHDRDGLLDLHDPLSDDLTRRPPHDEGLPLTEAHGPSQSLQLGILVTRHPRRRNGRRHLTHDGRRTTITTSTALFGGEGLDTLGGIGVGRNLGTLRRNRQVELVGDQMEAIAGGGIRGRLLADRIQAIAGCGMLLANHMQAIAGCGISGRLVANRSSLGNRAASAATSHR